MKKLFLIICLLFSFVKQVNATIAFRAVGTVATGNVSSISGNLPAGTNHLLIASLSFYFNPQPTGVSCTGWTLIEGNHNIGGDGGLYVFYREATGSDAISCSWTNGAYTTLWVADYTGAATSNPVDTSGIINSAQTACDANHCWAALTPSGQNEELILVGGSTPGGNPCIPTLTGSPSVNNRWCTAETTNIAFNAEWDLNLGASIAPTTRYSSTNAMTPIIDVLICPVGGCTSSGLRQQGIIIVGGPSPLQSCIGTAENPGDNVAADVAAASSGTTFCLAAGTYRGQSIVPKANDKFIGITGADLNGSIILSTWNTLSGPTVYYDTTEASTCSLPIDTSGASCNDGTAACRYPQDIYIDSVPVTRTLTYPPTSNRFYFDQTNSQGHGVAVYILTNPAGHTIELGCNKSAFSSSADNVTIKNLIMEKYAGYISGPGVGAVGAVGNNWMIANNIIKLNHADGIHTNGNSEQVINNTVNENGNGLSTGGGLYDLFQGNVVKYNNYSGIIYSYNGGSKFSLNGVSTDSTSGAQILNNEFGYNNGVGLWFDQASYYGIIKNNNVHHNLLDGIRYEISHRGTISNNTNLNNAELWPEQCIDAHIPLLNGNDVCTGHGTMSISHTCTLGGQTEIADAQSGNTTIGGGPGLGNTITSNCAGISFSTGTRNLNSGCTGNGTTNWGSTDTCCTGVGTGTCDDGQNNIATYNTIDWTNSPNGHILNRAGGIDTNSPTILFNNGSSFNHNTYKVHSLLDTNWYWCDNQSSSAQWDWPGFTSLGGCPSHPAQEANGTIITQNPAPPPLVSPQIFAPGAVFGGHTVVGNGIADDTAAMQAAVTASDLQINTGTYLLNGGSVVVPSGRNIRCGAGTTPDPTVILKYTLTSAYSVFNINNDTNNSVFGCTFAGPNYNINAEPGCQANYAAFITMSPTGSGHHIANNDFNGVGGFNGAVEISSNDANASNSPHNIHVEFNTFEHCGLRGTEVTSGHNNTFNNNIYSDCGAGAEAGDTGETNTGNLWDKEMVKFVYGTGQGRGCVSGFTNNHNANNVTGGSACHTKTGDPPCPYDYSGNTVSNSTCDSPTFEAWIWEHISSVIPANYTNNTVSGNCSIH